MIQKLLAWINQLKGRARPFMSGHGKDFLRFLVSDEGAYAIRTVTATRTSQICISNGQKQLFLHALHTSRVRSSC